ncbi:MAG TPA: type I DNA topoisomerase [Polyangiaceae bacterium]|nr:type I DNA topoisomerase [Polyangiaceae bacterium]
MAKASSSNLYALVVVESPTKAKTLKKYLGPGFEVMASKGHVKDLPKRLGIDVAGDFQETYEVIEGKQKVITELKGAAQKADRVLLATDPDREGEAIAMHLAEELKPLKLPMARVLFHEITKRGVTEGIQHPQELNENLYEAQRTRRVLDRLVGYDVSALVWSKVAFGLSAGRVQSVALRLIVEREREIEAFVPVEYWNVGVGLGGASPPNFAARLASADGEKFEVKDGETAAEVRADLESASYRVKAVAKKEQRRHAPAPYTTSKLQQDATNYLKFTAKRTMQVAQALYEGVELGKDTGPVGLITYMRTDSTRVSDEAVAAAREMVGQLYGKEYVPEKPNVFKSKKGAQDAHEAIRPAAFEHPPEAVKKFLKDEQYKLYKLIWDRFLASQMAAAVYDQTSVDIEAKVGREGSRRKAYGLRASGRVLKFAGWLEQYGKGLNQSLAGEDDEAEGAEKAAAAAPEAAEEGVLPPLKEGEALKRVDPPGVVTEQKFTQPPPRFNEGSLVRELEKRGIGRPSTYAEILTKVQARDYVEKLPSGALKPSELGRVVIDGLMRSNLDIIDPGFTAKMEEELDEVEMGKSNRVALLRRFYSRFREQLDTSKKLARWNPEPIDTGVACEVCGQGTMFKRWSKNGWFLGCSNYPKCKNTRNLDANGEATEPQQARETNIVCEKCNEARLVLKKGRYGDFLGCARYPKCDLTRPVPLGISCPKCKTGELVEIKPKKRGGRAFWGCSNYAATPSCDFKLWQRPVREACPKCAAPFLVLSGGKKEPSLGCVTEGCGYSRKLSAEELAKVLELAAMAPESIFVPAAEGPLIFEKAPSAEKGDKPAAAKGKGAKGKNGGAAAKGAAAEGAAAEGGAAAKGAAAKGAAAKDAAVEGAAVEGAAAAKGAAAEGAAPAKGRAKSRSQPQPA